MAVRRRRLTRCLKLVEDESTERVYVVKKKRKKKQKTSLLVDIEVGVEMTDSLYRLSLEIFVH